MLVYCAPLHRDAVPDGGNCLFKPWRAVDDEELGPSQTAPDEIVEDSSVRGRNAVDRYRA
jgi:hypothetical protein